MRALPARWRLDDMVIASLLLAALASHTPMNLPKGIYGPTVGAQCKSSLSALGTGNTNGSGTASTIINIWALERRNSGSNVGYVIKTESQGYWYEPPVPLAYQKLDDIELGVLIQHYRVEPCFTKDMQLKR